jgi:hypothetical protein
MCSQIDPCTYAKHTSNQSLLESIPRLIQRAKYPIRDDPLFERRIIYVELNQKPISHNKKTER